MYTSIVLVALSGVVAAPPQSSDASVWLTDYAVAYAKGQSEKKPLAVVFGTGGQDAEAISKDGKLDTDVLDLMRTNYVCVYIDMDSATGRTIAAGFKVTATPSLVLTDRVVQSIALRQTGAVTNADLVSRLKKYADPHHVVEATDNVVTTEVRYAAATLVAATPATMPRLGAPETTGSTPIIVSSTSGTVSPVTYQLVNGTLVPVSYSPTISTSTPVLGGSYIPAYTPTSMPGYTPSYAPGYAPAFGGFGGGGGCPGGRCGR